MSVESQRVQATRSSFESRFIGEERNVYNRFQGTCVIPTLMESWMRGFNSLKVVKAPCGLALPQYQRTVHSHRRAPAPRIHSASLTPMCSNRAGSPTP